MKVGDKALTLVFAGFGGQGVLTAGRIIVNMALEDGISATWLPAYGFAVRGGKAYCTVKLCSGEIGSPCLETIDILVAMNTPSLEFAADMNPGGVLIMNTDQIREDSELIPDRDDIRKVYVPCDSIARAANNPKAANLVSVGSVIKELDGFRVEAAVTALKDFFEEKGKGKYNEANVAAFMGGYENDGSKRG